MKKFCSNCREWKDSWADYPSHRPYLTYRRSERCWRCDEWTLSDRTIFVPSSSQLSRESIRERLDGVRTGRIGGFVCAKEDYISGERIRETLIYDGGETYTRVIERGGRQITETKELKTFAEVFFLEFIEAVIEEPIRAICPVS